MDSEAAVAARASFGASCAVGAAKGTEGMEALQSTRTMICKRTSQWLTQSYEDLHSEANQNGVLRDLIG